MMTPEEMEAAVDRMRMAEKERAGARFVVFAWMKKEREANQE